MAQEERIVCITPEEYKALIDMIKTQTVTINETNKRLYETSKDVKEVMLAMNIVKPAVERTHLLVTGNGHPEDGICHRVLVSEQDLKELREDFISYMKKQEEREEKRKERTFDLFKPAITTLIVSILMFILGGGLALLIK